MSNLRLIGVDEIFYGRPKKFLAVVVDQERGRDPFVYTAGTQQVLKSKRTRENGGAHRIALRGSCTWLLLGKR